MHKIRRKLSSTGYKTRIASKERRRNGKTYILVMHRWLGRGLADVIIFDRPARFTEWKCDCMRLLLRKGGQIERLVDDTTRGRSRRVLASKREETIGFEYVFTRGVGLTGVFFSVICAGRDALLGYKGLTSTHFCATCTRSVVVVAEAEDATQLTNVEDTEKSCSTKAYDCRFGRSHYNLRSAQQIWRWKA